MTPPVVSSSPLQGQQQQQQRPRGSGSGGSVGGEPHRIYWQQWIANANSSMHDEPKPLSRRELITSSAAVRMSTSATIADITTLLRHTMELQDANDDDSIVLVGTLHSTSNRLVQFDQRFVVEQQQQQSSSFDNGSSSAESSRRKTKPFHVVQTLRGDARPLQARERMLRYLESVLERDSAIEASVHSSSSTTTSIIAPKLQFFYIPSPRLEAMPVLIPNCVELDGYATDIDESVDDEPNEFSDHHDDINDDTINNDAENEFQPIEEMFPWLVRPDAVETTTKTDKAKEYHSNLADELQRLSKSHSGFVLQCDRNDPYVWRTVWCALAADYLWSVSRIREGGYAHIQRIHLARALLLQPCSDYPPLFKTPYAWEIVAEDGTTHLFRASCRTSQRAWIDSITERIVAAYETSLLVQAETLIVDNCVARSKRCTKLAVDPLATARNGSMKHNVLQFGMAVSNYHECFRLDIATWNLAKSLRKQAGHMVELYGKDRSRLSTLCKHLDFVMTGRQRSSSSGFLGGAPPTTAENDTPQEGTPPKDLFDAILSELQTLACSVSSS
jgi:hypothetical protein